MIVLESTDEKASLYVNRDGFHVAVLIKVENENQLAVAVRSNNVELSKSFAEEIDAIFKEAS